MSRKQILHFLDKFLLLLALSMTCILLGMYLKSEMVKKELDQIKSITIEKIVPIPNLKPLNEMIR